MQRNTFKICMKIKERNDTKSKYVRKLSPFDETFLWYAIHYIREYSEGSLTGKFARSVRKY